MSVQGSKPLMWQQYHLYRKIRSDFTIFEGKKLNQAINSDKYGLYLIILPKSCFLAVCKNVNMTGLFA